MRTVYGIDQGFMQFVFVTGALAHAIAVAFTVGAAIPSAPMINLFVR
jgi:hypothetical protein